MKLTNGTSKQARCAFPEQLLKLLSDEGNSDAITWTADGAQVKIVSRALLETKVLPKYFNQQSAKVESFQRKLKRWGFRRTGRGIYSHPFFQKGKLDLLGYMVHDDDRKNDSSLFSAALSSQLQEGARVGYSCRVVDSFVHKQWKTLEAGSGGEPKAKNLLEGNINNGKTNNLNKAASLALKSEQDESQNNNRTLTLMTSPSIAQPILTSSSCEQSNTLPPQQLYDTNQLLMMPTAPLLQNNNILPTQYVGPSEAVENKTEQHGGGNIIEQQQVELIDLISANNRILLSLCESLNTRRTVQHGEDNSQQQTGLNGQQTTTNSFKGMNATDSNKEQELHGMGDSTSLTLGDNNAVLQPGMTFSELATTTAAARSSTSVFDLTTIKNS